MGQVHMVVRIWQGMYRNGQVVGMKRIKYVLRAAARGTVMVATAGAPAAAGAIRSAGSALLGFVASGLLHFDAFTLFPSRKLTVGQFFAGQKQPLSDRCPFKELDCKN